MNIVRTLSLSHKQREDIRSLTSLCRQNDDLILSCPEDGDEFWILYEENAGGAMECPAACFAVYKTEPDLWECYAFTRPGCRGRGYFSALCSMACEDSCGEGEPDLCFITDNRCAAALEALKHMEAGFLYDEYRMALEPGLAGGDMTDDSGHGAGPDTSRELFLRIMPDDGLSKPYVDDAAQTGATGIPAPAGTPEDFAQTGAPEDFGDLPEQMTVTAWLKSGNAKHSPMTGHGAPSRSEALTASPSLAGSCRLCTQGRDGYLYALEILPQLRGRGYGTCFMDCVISMLKDHGYSGLSLQVSGANEPALGLYKKTGFRITETLSYYLY